MCAHVYPWVLAPVGQGTPVLPAVAMGIIHASHVSIECPCAILTGICKTDVSIHPLKD
jgi:hypothetical protein